jgi:serine/threonine protein kinase
MRSYDWKADVWSLGCVLYEMLEHRSPFYAEGDNLFRLAKKITKGKFAPLPASYSDKVSSPGTGRMNGRCEGPVPRGGRRTLRT